MPKSSPWPGLASACVIALSLAVAWAFIALMTGAIADNGFSGPTRQESIIVVADGTPLIASHSSTDWQNVDYYTLDRKPVQLRSENPLAAAHFSELYAPPGVVEWPIDWSERIGGMSNHSRPFAAWYVIRDAERPGRAYVVAYDPASKLPFAYASKSGVLPEPPAKEDWFEVGDATVGWNQNFATGWSGGFMPAQYVNHQNINWSVGPLAPGFFYIKDGDRLLEINTRDKSVRVLAEIPGIQSLSVITEPFPDRPGRVALPNQARLLNFRNEDKRLPVRSVQLPQIEVDPFDAPAKIDTERPTQSQLAVRSEGQITIVHPQRELVRSFKLPAQFHDARLTVYSVGDGRLLLQRSDPSNPGSGVVELYWIDEEGEIVEEKRVKLASYQQTSPRTIAWQAAGIAPTPIGWILSWTILGPLSMLQYHQAATFSAAFREMTANTWPAMTAVIVLGVVLSLFVLRTHRKHFRSHPLLWSALVFCFGPAGLAAYALHWRRPAMDHCAACGNRVPRDRDHCPACATEWPEPTRLGSEVFA